MAANLIVKAAVKQIINSRGMKVSSEVIDNALNKKVEEVVLAAIERAKANGRKTVYPQDL
ncbi:MAG: histone-like protein [Candidatus Odinarchaeia archaeon]